MAKGVTKPDNPDRKAMLVLGGVAIGLALVLGALGYWMAYGTPHRLGGVAVPIQPLNNDVIAPTAAPKPPAPAMSDALPEPLKPVEKPAGNPPLAPAAANNNTPPASPAAEPSPAGSPPAAGPGSPPQPPAAQTNPTAAPGATPAPPAPGTGSTPQESAAAKPPEQPTSAEKPPEAKPAETSAGAVKPETAPAASPAPPAPVATPLPAPLPPATTKAPPPEPIPATAAKPPPGSTLVFTPPPLNNSAANGEHALNPAPDPGLIERGKYGFEPVTGHDGRVAWQVYARPFNLGDPRPRVAIIVTGLGIGSTTTDAAINKLPADVTLAFAPFSRRISEWTSLARLAGHEVLLELPMEPIDYPRQDPGYNALLVANTTEQNLDRLDWTLSQTVGYVGLIGRMGGRFQAARESLTPPLQDIASRGLLFVDNRAAAESSAPAIAAAAKLPYAATSRVLDAQPDGAIIVRNLADLEDIARRNKVALGLVSAAPGAMDRISQWAAGLAQRGIALAPVSAIVTIPAPPPPPANPDGAPAPADQPAAAPATVPEKPKT